MDATDGATAPQTPNLTRATAGEPVALTLVGGYKDSGEPVYENLLVAHLTPSIVRLIKSPGIVLGIAAGDTICVDGSGKFTLIERAGNIAVQIYGNPGPAGTIEFDIEALGGLAGWRA